MTRLVIPWQAGCQHRAAALEWVLARYALRHPDFDVHLAELAPGPWVKARAVNAGARGLDDEDLVIVADADVWCDELQSAVRAVQAGTGWAVPHRGVHRLTAVATATVLAGAEPGYELEHAERGYRGTLGGGLVVLTAGLLRAVPMDPRFTGWGGEDRSWGIALSGMAGRPWHGLAPLWHLFHPAQPRLSRAVGSQLSDELCRRYRAARENPDALRALIDETREAVTA